MEDKEATTRYDIIYHLVQFSGMTLQGMFFAQTFAQTIDEWKNRRFTMRDLQSVGYWIRIGDSLSERGSTCPMMTAAG